MTKNQSMYTRRLANRCDAIWLDLDNVIYSKPWSDIPLKTDKQHNWDIFDAETGETINLLDLRDQLQALSNICSKMLEEEE